MMIVNIHTLYIGTESKRPDGNPIPAAHNFKTDFKIDRKSRRLIKFGRLRTGSMGGILQV
jgi:hypothetical protein